MFYIYIGALVFFIIMMAIMGGMLGAIVDGAGC